MVNKRVIPIILLAVATMGSCNYNHPLNNDYDNNDNNAEPARSIAVTVIDYSPMPGQFINTTPPYSEGDNAISMANKATNYLTNGYAISLGSWGGSITLRLHEPITHRKSGRDFRILGNAFYNNSSSATEQQRYGAAEPGIILVSPDTDNDGKPDCWYEIRGSEHDNSISSFTITYTKSDSGDINWATSTGQTGTIKPNKFHEQPYFPQWIESGKLTATGRRLPDNGHILPTGVYAQTCFNFGYADNQPNNRDESIINLEWAIDNEGNSVELPSICFIKIYTGVFQESSELGECSTEIIGVEIPSE